MAQTHTVRAAQKEHRCQSCGQPIEVGTSYKWFKMKLARGGVKKSYHVGCTIPPSHRTTSRMGTIWDAQAALNLDGQETTDGIREELEAFAQTVREVSEEYGESADNIESGFQHETYQSQELRERAEALETWADEIEQWEFSGDEPEEDDHVKTDTEEYDAAVKAWEREEPTVDESEEDEDELQSQITAHEEWESNEPSEHEYEITDTEAYEAAVEEMLQEARDDASGVVDNCPV